jgi:hypothetical protein
MLIANPIRRVRDHGIDLAERRQDLKAVPEVQRAIPDDLNPTHGNTPKMHSTTYPKGAMARTATVNRKSVSHTGGLS